ncbi:MAG: glutathione S-transferase family protein, partial [Pseudomonas sp.]|nr:glutathione S-transferase family protein [Pseudomonas sp.]
MGLLIDGRWHDQWYDTGDSGRFQRESAQRRNWVTADGSAGPSGSSGFKAEAGRYHLYVSLACPWAHRTLILRKLKGLESLINVSVVSWLMREQGWTFDREFGSSSDHLDNLGYMHQRYTADDSHYTGRVTVPVLWDKQRGGIVSNAPAEIL